MMITGRERLEDFAWGEAPSSLSPPLERVDVWRLDAGVDEKRIEALSNVLSEEEHARAERLLRPRRRRQFVLARVLLRNVLADYLGARPEALRFQTGAHGKPTLCGEHAAGGTCFNLSHSGDVVLLAVTCGRQVGVDVEKIRPDVECRKLARRFFSSREAEALAALPERERLRAFFVCWTRKEAFLKAKAQGMSVPLERFAVSLAPNEPARLLEHLDEPLAPSKWWFRDLDAGENYAASLVADGKEAAVNAWSWRLPWT